MEKKSNREKILKLVEGAVMVALAFGLSCVKLFELPYGGTITFLSMLPIVVYSIRNGVASGLMCSFVYALTQLAQGIFVSGLLGWGLTPGLLVGCILLDYIIPFTILGLAGIFRTKGVKGWITGTVGVILIRLMSHVLSGVFIFKSAGLLWEGLEISNSWLYSMAYNGFYMIPEMILTTIGAVILFNKNIMSRLLKNLEVKT
ncbi:MAG: proton-coupled thiamine transporter YuaJ [Ruminococcaceae bacterium]|nr:proton-coupled thiamine transporter YuaJ [Oscillospiraceae bacterium]